MEHEAKTAACCVVLWLSVDLGGEEEEGKELCDASEQVLLGWECG